LIRFKEDDVMNFVEPFRHTKDIKTMLDICEEEGKYKEKLLLLFGINSSLRISDLLKLKWDDVLTPERKRIKNQFKIKEGKTGKTKVITINAMLKEGLEDFMKHDPTMEGYLFKSEYRDKEGQPITRQYAHKFIKWITYAAGLEGNYSTHSLRKTFGYRAREAGVDISKLMLVLNHSSPEVTLRYLGYTAREIANVYDIVAMEL